MSIKKTLPARLLHYAALIDPLVHLRHYIGSSQ